MCFLTIHCLTHRVCQMCFACMYSVADMSIQGDWDAKGSGSLGLCCYKGVWRISESGNEVVAKEQCGSTCLICVPNCFPKTHTMTKAGNGEWKGTLCFKPVSLKQQGENELMHYTTDGPMKMTRM